MISQLVLTNPISSPPSPSNIALGPNKSSSRYLETPSSYSKTVFWNRRQRMNYSKNAIFQNRMTDKRFPSYASGPERLDPSHYLKSKQDSTRTPSLSSSISTASSDSELLEPLGADATKPQHIVLYRSTNSKGCFFPKALSFCASSLVKSNETFGEISDSRNDALPMIVLTPPDDEDDYCTVSPFILELFCPYTTDSVVHHQNLRVPTAPTSKGIESNSKRRKYPHPAGPWLRPQHTANLRTCGRSAVSSSPLTNKRLTWRWEDGCRTAQGTVVGWEATVSYFIKQYNSQNKLKKAATKHGESPLPKKIIYPAVFMFPPPRLPNEKEIQQRQLQFTIEQSLRLGRKVNRKRQNRHPSFHHKASQSTGDLN
ncbi:hypothetical protein PGT21_006304 [Puccinia graminis f. sp. tritici]|uniref:Uncharacterized protein n=1 Tax=Puccinia graminis f. sp. tritici TaxID=56615 RepID=A0A5B0P8U0_PUCGR|nr:hypothetical protein PGT21_006304 [Puccinia graminis f. sp. tritici]KAA1134217.1 hypothetical protein PGTUg99_032859 [Puccinia graminis f. sp. tritici]